MLIELLYFDGCPSWEKGLVNLQAALSAEYIDSEIELVPVETNAAALKERFLGSPSFRVNGVDLWPEQRNSYYLGCRVYPTSAGMQGAPTVAMIRERLAKLDLQSESPDSR